MEAAGGAPENLVSMTWYVVEGAAPRSFMEDALEITAARERGLPRPRNRLDRGAGEAGC